MGGPEDLVVRNYLEWSDAGRPAIWRYLVAIVLGFLFWMWGSIPAILLLQNFLNDPATKSIAFEYTFVVGLVAIPLITRYLLKRPAFSVALPSWPPRLADYGLGIAIQWAAMVFMYLLAVKVSFRGWDHVTAACVPMLFAALLGLALQTAFEELYLIVNTKGDVLQTVTPFIAETPTIERAALFAVGQAALTTVAVEWIVRRRVARVPRATAPA